MPKTIDSTGSKIGRLTVIYEYYKYCNGRKRFMQHCICVCGKEVERIKHSDTKSCGCIKKKNIDIKVTKIRSHWQSMKQRCYDKHHEKYYKNKGISVCERWLEFGNFYEDMSETWQFGLELDRIENDKGYYKENCRWATEEVQQRNRTCSKLTKEQVEEIKNMSGIEYKEIAKLYNIDPSHVSRIKNNKKTNGKK